MKINRISLTAAVALAVGTLLACSNMGMAQDTKDAPAGKRRAASPEDQLERLSTQLNLTDAQKPKVKEVLEEGAKKRTELRGTPQDERRDKMRALMEDQNKKMK